LSQEIICHRCHQVKGQVVVYEGKSWCKDCFMLEAAALKDLFG